MLFHNVLCVCVLALLAPKIETNAQFNSETEKPEALFADVIKNISRVNNELQDLINNYEQFKKPQNSLENFDDKEDYISDAEGGRINRNNKNSVANKKGTSNKTSTTFKFQTEMTYVEDESEKSSEPKKSIETEKMSQSQHSNEVDKRHEVESRKPMGNTGKKNVNVKKTNTEAIIANEEPIAPKEETEPENQKFLDIYKTTIKTDRKKRIMPQAEVEHAPKKTKYFEIQKLTKYLNLNSSGSDSSLESERHTEEEVDASKPKERAYEKDTEVTQVTAAIFLRSHINESKTTKVFLTTTAENKNLYMELTDNDEALSKDLFTTNVLRQAYGDACFKLVVRKCYRACKSAFKSSCQVINCKSEMKKYFDKSSRTGCIDAFNASSKGDNSTSLRRIITYNYPIVTRDEYLSVACQTQIEKPTRRMSNGTANQNGEPINILRDRYERECQKISQNKCVKACNCAQTSTCAEYKCNKRLKKNFKRNCRMECKVAYSNEAKKISDSDYSDDDDDDDYDDDEDDDEDKDDDDNDDDD